MPGFSLKRIKGRWEGAKKIEKIMSFWDRCIFNFDCRWMTLCFLDLYWALEAHALKKYICGILNTLFSILFSRRDYMFCKSQHFLFREKGLFGGIFGSDFVSVVADRPPNIKFVFFTVSQICACLFLPIVVCIVLIDTKFRQITPFGGRSCLYYGEVLLTMH